VKQLKKLEKVLEFYQQQLEIVKTRFGKQNAIVTQKQTEAHALATELVLTQQRFSKNEPTPSNLQMVNHVMELMETGIRDKQQELAEEQRLLDARRIELREQLTRMEAIENIVSRKSKTIQHERRQREQHLADERYLNMNFTGLKK
jgi:hypothetical protein